MQIVKGQKVKMHLIHERKLEILRSGFRIIFHARYMSSYFEFDQEEKQKIVELLENKKYAIQFCQKDFSVHSSRISPDKFYFTQKQPCRMFIKQTYFAKKFRDGHLYYLVKTNTTLSILKDVCSQMDKIDDNILKFINQQTIKTNPNPLQINQYQIEDLNNSQQQAIKKALKNPITFIRGPPGCGKTKVVARVARIFCRLDKAVLVGAASNTAIKSIMRQIIKDLNEYQKLNFSITLFLFRQTKEQNDKHPPEIKKYTLRYKIIQTYKAIYKSILTNQRIDQISFNILLDLHWTDRNFQPPSNFYSLYKQAQKIVIRQTQLMIATTISVFKINSKNKLFSPYVGILDEAAQTTWADSLCFLTQGLQKILFVGDDLQLSPTILSQDKILKQTMFSLSHKNSQYYTLLNIQYRMHPILSQFPNQQFYKGKLKNGISHEDRLSNINYFKYYPLSFITHDNIQTAITEMDQITKDPQGRKKYINKQQIQMIGQILKLFNINQLNNVGIITPYDQQLKIIKTMYSQYLNYGLTVKTCDGYQGGQKQYMIVSCVRSNIQGKIGFCKQKNRLNVTLTRAKKGMIIIGNSQNLSKIQGECWSNYIKYLKQKKLIFDQSILKNYIKQNEKKLKLNEQIKIQSYLQDQNQSLKNNQEDFQKFDNQQKQTQSSPQHQIIDSQQQKILKILLKIEQQWKHIDNTKDQNQDQDQYANFFKKKINKDQRNKLSHMLQDYRISLNKKNHTQLLQNQYKNKLCQKIISLMSNKSQNSLKRMTLIIYQKFKELIKEWQKSLLKINQQIQQIIERMYKQKQYDHRKQWIIIYQLLSRKILREQIIKVNQYLTINS